MTVHVTEQLANTVYGLEVPPLTWQQKKRARSMICALAGRGLNVADDGQCRAAAEAARRVLEALDLIPDRFLTRRDSAREDGRLELPSGRKHATKSSYNYGCRCKACTRAAVDEVTQRRRLNAELLRRGLIAVQHGQLSTYTNYLCRCPPCTEANRSYLADWRDRRRKAGL